METFEQEMENQQKSFDEAEYDKGFVTEPGKYQCNIYDVKIKKKINMDGKRFGIF